MAAAVPPQIAAIIRAGANHPQYKQAVAWLDNAKYNDAKQSEARTNAAYARQDVEQRAKSGALDAVPEHYWSTAERNAMSPIVAERKAKADHAEAQRLKELQAKNPYRYQLETMKPADKEEARLQRVAEKGSGYAPQFQEEARRQLEARGSSRSQLQGMADAVDAANDPYVKLKNEEAKARQTALKEQARERDAAMADVARRYLENPSIFESTYGADAANAAKSLSKQFLEGQVRKAGGPQVSFGGEAFGQSQQPSAPAAPSGVKGAIVEAGKIAGALGGNTLMASSSLGSQGAPAAPASAATSAPGVPAQESKFDSWEVAKRLHDPSVPEDQKMAMQASLQPWQKKMVQDSLSSYRTLQDDLSAAKNAGGPTNWSEGMKGFIDRGVGRLASAGKAFVDFAGRNAAGTSNADSRLAPAPFQPMTEVVGQAGAGLEEWRKANVNAVDAENRDMQGKMEGFRRSTVKAMTPGESDLTMTNPELFSQDMPPDTVRARFGSFDPEKDPAVIARRQLNGY